jgi:hypothetical protein
MKIQILSHINIPSKGTCPHTNVLLYNNSVISKITIYVNACTYISLSLTLGLNLLNLQYQYHIYQYHMICICIITG